VPSTSVSMTPNRTYQPVFSKLWRISGLEKMAVKFAEPCEVVRRRERVDVHERVDRREHRWVQRESQDEDEQRCDHGVAHGLRPARTSAGEPCLRSAPTRVCGLRHAPPSSQDRGPGHALGDGLAGTHVRLSSC